RALREDLGERCSDHACLSRRLDYGRRVLDDRKVLAPRAEHVEPVERLDLVELDALELVSEAEHRRRRVVDPNRIDELDALEALRDVETDAHAIEARRAAGVVLVLRSDQPVDLEREFRTTG